MHTFRVPAHRNIWYIAAMVAGLLLLGTVTVTAQGPQPQVPQSALLGPGFTYQGQLKKSGAPVNDACSMTFSLWDAQTSGTQLGTQTVNSVAVANGMFTVVLNTGNELGAGVFNGADRWLQASVKCSTDLTAIALSRQQLSAAPYALFSAAPWVTSGSDLSYSAGNVGIGLANPTQKLDVAGNVLIYPPSGFGIVKLRNRTASDYSQMIFSDDTNNERGYLGYIGAAAPFGPRDDTVELGSNGKDITVRPNGHEVMRLTAAGSVGIGTASPAAPLEVYGTDTALNIRNGNDSGGAFSGNTYNSLQLGLYNPTSSAWGAIPANTARSFFGFDNNGLVCSLTNAFPDHTACRNALDDGIGDAIISGTATVYGEGFFLTGLHSGGKVTISTLGTAGATSLCINGSLEIAFCSSSRRYKSNIADLPLGLETLLQLRPVTYDWSADGQHDLGLVAEEVNAVAPVLTTFNKDGQVEGVKYDRLTAVLVKGIQEQQQQLADLKSQNAALAQKSAALESRAVTQQIQLDAFAARDATQQAQIDSLESHDTAQQTQLDALTARNTSQQVQLDALTSRIAAVEQSSPASGARPQSPDWNTMLALAAGGFGVVLLDRARRKSK